MVYKLVPLFNIKLNLSVPLEVKQAKCSVDHLQYIGLFKILNNCDSSLAKMIIHIFFSLKMHTKFMFSCHILSFFHGKPLSDKCAHNECPLSNALKQYIYWINNTTSEGPLKCLMCDHWLKWNLILTDRIHQGERQLIQGKKVPEIGYILILLTWYQVLLTASWVSNRLLVTVN